MHQKVILDSIISDEDGTISEIQVVIDAIHHLQTTTAQGLAPAEFNNFLSSLCEVSEVNPSLRKTIVSLLCMTSARQTDEGLLRFDESGMIDRLMTELSRYNFDGLPRKGSVLTNIKVKLRDNLKTDNGALAENIGRLDDYVDDYDYNYYKMYSVCVSLLRLFFIVYFPFCISRSLVACYGRLQENLYGCLRSHRTSNPMRDQHLEVYQL